MANALTWKAYRNGDQIIIGAAEWQTCTTKTVGILEVFTDEAEARDLPKLLRRAAATPMDRVNELKSEFTTWDRFEAACDAGHFGAPW